MRLDCLLKRFSTGVSKLPRVYFYEIDDSGRVYLEGVKHRNMTTCMSDVKFLNQLFQRLQLTKTWAEKKKLPANVSADKYPFLSTCMGELNFIKVETTPIVFREIFSHEGVDMLRYGVSSTVRFRPDEITVNAAGKMFHPAPAGGGGLGLISSTLAQQMGREIQYVESKNEFQIIWKDKGPYSIKGAGSLPWVNASAP